MLCAEPFPLSQMPEEQAFSVLVKIMFDYGLRELFKQNFEDLHCKFYQLERLMQVGLGPGGGVGQSCRKPGCCSRVSAVLLTSQEGWGGALLCQPALAGSAKPRYNVLVGIHAWTSLWHPEEAPWRVRSGGCRTLPCCRLSLYSTYLCNLGFQLQL